jgi:glycine cleavage system pyridoxal-binding protein P
VCQTRADGLGLKAEVVKGDAFEFSKDVCGMLVQYPDTHGSVNDYKVRTRRRSITLDKADSSSSAAAAQQQRSSSAAAAVLLSRSRGGRQQP